MKKLRITIEGKSYDVEVELLGEEHSNAGHSAATPARATSANTAIAAPTAPAPAKPTTTLAGPGTVSSPLAATIVSIDVQTGQQVDAGDKLLTLEAMKMNTIVNAPQSGVVSEILVQSAQSVEEGQPLISLA
ncbi:biotin/lipoyl-binding protein [Puniceicoccaceae bacterium K14]|nr:biotin/lipoyl-binding protein [Puniceicoccaceae bacterium K14]